jgi:hypothetical protein
VYTRSEPERIAWSADVVLPEAEVRATADDGLHARRVIREGADPFDRDAVVFEGLFQYPARFRH